VDLLIFITVGSSEEYKFPRLLQIIDELCDEDVFKGEDVIAQIGYTEYKPRNYKAFDMTSDEEFKALVEKADIVITHAGTGSVTSALKLHRKVIIFPRQFKYREHLDDHQLELAELFADKGYALSATDKDELRDKILYIDEFHPVEFVSSNKRINQLVIDFIGE
jgi:UDP-N-acetylglucosamine transferase subunit ALG13